MNIFAIDKSPIACARALDDKRVIKMVLETCQILSTAVWNHGGEGPYRQTHAHHPCCIWAMQTRANYMWTYALFEALAMEFKHRWEKAHKSWALHGETLLATAELIPPGELTPLPQCTPGVPKMEDVHEAYRRYLALRWARDNSGRVRWTKRLPPEWKNLN